MQNVTIYTKSTCGYCQMAKALLAQKSVPFTEIDVSDPVGQRAMAAKAGRSSVPQIYIGATHVGGCDELHALERAGRLDALLAGAAT